MSREPVMEIDKSTIAEVLDSKEELQRISNISGLAIDALKSIFAKLLEEPEVRKEAEEFAFSPDASPDLKAYVSGMDIGRKTGHSDGFGKGVAITLAVLALAAAAIMLSRK